MVCLGFEPATEGWQAQTNPLSYGCPPATYCLPTPHLQGVLCCFSVCENERDGRLKTKILTIEIFSPKTSFFCCPKNPQNLAPLTLDVAATSA